MCRQAYMRLWSYGISYEEYRALLEQQIGRPERRIDQMRTVDFDDLIRCRLLPVAIHGWHDSTMRHRRRGTKSRLIAADCT